jgi:hypothetical protein
MAELNKAVKNYLTKTARKAREYAAEKNEDASPEIKLGARGGQLS